MLLLYSVLFFHLSVFVGVVAVAFRLLVGVAALVSVVSVHYFFHLVLVLL